MMTRKEIEEKNRKQHILQVAETLFSQKGLQSTSVADIAQAAEFGVGTIYKYFKDKNTLITSLAQERISEHFDKLEDALESAEIPPEQIENFIEAYLKSIQARKNFFKIYYIQLHPGSVEVSENLKLEKLEQRKLELFARVDDIYQQGIKQGYFANIGDAGYLTAATWGILMAFYFMAEQKFDGEVRVDEMKDMIQKLLFEKVRLSA